MARPKRGNYAYGPEGDARYKKNLREYLKKQKEAREKKTKIESTKKNIDNQKAANKKATTTTKPKSSAAKGKSLATSKRPGMTKAEKQEMLKGNSLQDKEKALKTTKTRTKTRTQTKSKTTTKPVAKKPVAKKPVAKKPVAKKPAGKVPAKKPLISNKNKLRIKKGAEQAADTTKRVVKEGVKQGKKLASNVKKKVDATKKAFDKPSPTKRPTTRLQKLASKGNKFLKSAGKYTKNQVLPKARKDLLKIGKGIAKDPKSLVKGAKGAGISYLAEKGLNQLADRATKQIRKETRGKNMTLKEYRAMLEKNKKAAREKYGPLPGYGKVYQDIKKQFTKGKTKNNQSSTTKNINKQKKVNNNSGLKIKKTQRSSNKNTNKNYNAPTATKKADKRFSTFRVDAKENRNLQLERQKGNTETYSRKLSPQAKKQVTDTKTNKKEKPKSKFIKTSKGTLARRGSVTARRAENRERARKRAQEMARRRLANK